MYSICLNIKDKLCVVVGGGGVAERKVRGLLAEGARVLVIAPYATEYIQRLAAEGLLEWLRKGYEKGDLSGACLVFAATGARDVQKSVHDDAAEADLLVNVADDPGACDFHVPATVCRGDLNIAVSTNGKSPAVAAMVRKQVQRVIGDEYRVLLELISLVRERVIEDVAEQNEKRNMFRNLLQEDILDWIKYGQWDRVENHFNSILGTEITIDWKSFRRKTS